MKRLFPLVIIMLLPLDLLGQNQVDALRYSQTYSGGTARSVALGGAFGALGGDFYTVSPKLLKLKLYLKMTSNIILTSIISVMSLHLILLIKASLAVVLPSGITS